MSNSPRVSVILPTYDRPEVIDRAIRSVLNQTFSDFELLVVDSSTNSRTQSKVESFGDERITYLSQAPKGPSAARNLGIDTARGEFIAFQDDDDEWHPEKLETQLEQFEDCSERVCVVYTAVRKISGEATWTVPDTEVNPKEGNIRASLQHGNFVSPQTVLARARCIDEIGQFDENLPALEDWEMWIRLSKFFEFSYIPEIHTTAYLSPDSLSRDFKLVAKARDTIVRKHLDYFNEEAAAEQFFWSGHGFLKTGKTRRGRVNLRKAMHRRFRVRYLGSYFLSFLGSRVYYLLYRLYKSTVRRSVRV